MVTRQSTANVIGLNIDCNRPCLGHRNKRKTSPQERQTFLFIAAKLSIIDYTVRTNIHPPLPTRQPLGLQLQTKARLVAALIHLGLSLLVAVLCALLVFQLWYPAPLDALAGGSDLFLLIVAVDVVLGPLLTAVVFNTAKPKKELVSDITVVGLLQVAALLYGLHTMHQARPAWMVLEVDRIRLLRPIDLDDADLAKAPQGLQQLSWLGSKRAATRDIEPEEVPAVTDMALAGRDIGSRPDFWLGVEQTPAAWAKAARPMQKLHAMHPTRKSDIDVAVKATGKPESEVKWLAILARNTGHTALIDAKTGDIVGYAPVDGN
jgi:hypothetical protein